MRTAIVLAAAIFALPVLAAEPCDCPTPKPIPCERLKALAAKRCPPEVPIVKIVDHTIAVPGPERIVTKEVLIPGPERVVTIEKLVPIEVAPRGHWLLGGGAAYFHGLGIQAVTGWRSPKGWEIVGGPWYIPQNDVQGYDASCKIGCKTCNLSVPAVEAPHPYGGSVMFVYAF